MWGQQKGISQMYGNEMTWKEWMTISLKKRGRQDGHKEACRPGPVQRVMLKQMS